MQKIKVSAVSYANTLPFVYGLTHSPVKNEIDLFLDVPSVCADKLVNGHVAIGLIPVVEILKLDTYHIISDFCIGANGKVRTVALISDVPLQEIENVYLDFQSRTSVQLVQVLAREYWKITPEFLPAKPGFESLIEGKNAAVIIGDRVFQQEGSHKYVYDLAYEWKKYSGFPFVFAAWIAREKLNDDFHNSFNAGLTYGLNHLPEMVNTTSLNPLGTKRELISYYENNIDFKLDNEKLKSMEYFLNLVLKNK